jgi:acetyl esterase/lipase
MNFSPTIALLLMSFLALQGCATKDAYTIQKDLAYVSGGGERQQGDLYLPNGAGPFPTALVLHGGDWVGRDRKDMESAAETLAQNGFAAFNVNYRLAPEHRYPAQLEDTHAALRFLAENATKWQLDTARFATVGYSAGSQLALLAAEKPDPDGPAIRAIVAGGAPVDFMLYPKSPFITKLIGGPPSEFPELWKDASPINHITASHPPVYIFHAQFDQLVEIKNARMLASALSEAGVAHTLKVRYFLGHLLVGLYLKPSIKDAIPFLQESLKTNAH